MSTGMDHASPMGMRQAVKQSVETMSQWILYWLSLDTEVRALTERLVET
jgi:hypothetical protein